MSCPADHPHRSGCYQRHKCKCDKCRSWVAALRRAWVKAKQARQDKIEFEPWQLEIARKVYGKNE